jgi:bacteriocin-like protein
MDHAKSDMIELTDAELETIVGGNWLGDAFRAIGGAIKDAVGFIGGLIFGGLQGPGNQRGPFGPGSGPGQPPF